MAETPSTFQLTGRSASSDMVERKSMSSSVKPLRQPATISSTVVPSCWRTAAARRSISSPAGGPRRDGLAVAVVVGVDLRGREAERPLRQRRVQRRLHGVEIPGVGRAPDGPLAHDEPAQRRMPDEEPGVHGDAAVQAARTTRRTSPSPRADRPAARPAACPRPAPSSARCSRRAPAPSAPARSRSCRRAPWSRRAAGRGWRWGPRRAARRSGCAGRRNRGRRACPVASITVSAPALSAPDPMPTTRSPSITTSARTGGAPVPSTTVPPRIATVMSVPPVPPAPADAPAPAGGRRPACPRSPARHRSRTASSRPSARTCRWPTGRGH